MNGVLQKSCLDQVFSCNADLIENIDYLAKLGKSDHICMCIKLKLTNNIDFCTQIKQNWYKVDKSFVKNRSSAINWDFSCDAVTVHKMWDEMWDKN